MSTYERRKLERALLRWALTALLCALLGLGYEMFSHGVVSLYMVFAFLLPLGLGCGGCTLLLLCAERSAGEWSASLWGLGVAVLTVGSFVQGALEIYGTANALILVYPIGGMLLLAGGAAALFAGK